MKKHLSNNRTAYFWALGLGLFLGYILSHIEAPRNAEAATMTRGYTFATNELVTAAKLHSLVDSGTLSAIVSADITDGTIVNADLSNNSVTTANILDGTILAADIATRTLSTTLYGTNSVDAIALSTNLDIRSGTWVFTNINTTINFSGPSTTLTYSSNQINWAAVSGVTNSAGAADTGKVVKLNDSGFLDTSITPFSKSFTSTNIAITAAGTTTQAHGLGVIPTLTQCRIINTSTDAGYSASDEVIIPSNGIDLNNNIGVTVTVDATNLSIRFGSAAGSIGVLNKGTGAVASIDDTKWVFKISAWK
jgi:hypothetical protein